MCHVCVFFVQPGSDTGGDHGVDDMSFLPPLIVLELKRCVPSYMERVQIWSAYAKAYAVIAPCREYY